MENPRNFDGVYQERWEFFSQHVSLPRGVSWHCVRNWWLHRNEMPAKIVKGGWVENSRDLWVPKIEKKNVEDFSSPKKWLKNLGVGWNLYQQIHSVFLVVNLSILFSNYLPGWTFLGDKSRHINQFTVFGGVVLGSMNLLYVVSSFSFPMCFFSIYVNPFELGAFDMLFYKSLLDVFSVFVVEQVRTWVTQWCFASQKSLGIFRSSQKYLGTDTLQGHFGVPDIFRNFPPPNPWHWSDSQNTKKHTNRLIRPKTYLPPNQQTGWGHGLVPRRVTPKLGVK